MDADTINAAYVIAGEASTCPALAMLAVGPGINALPPVRLLAGDLNGDGCVDSADVEIVSAAYGADLAQGDINADGVVDIADAALVAGNFGLCGPIKF